MIATRETLAPSVHVGVGGERNRLHVLGAGQLAGAPGCLILRIAGDPERNEVVPPSKRGNQGKCPSCVAITPMRYVNRVADLTGIEAQCVRDSDPQTDPTNGLAGIHAHDREVVGRNPALLGNGR
jgi:hypothetical protein